MKSIFRLFLISLISILTMLNLSGQVVITSSSKSPILTSKFATTEIGMNMGGKNVLQTKGIGSVKNDKDEVIAEGDLIEMDGITVLKVKDGSTFKFCPTEEIFPEGTFSDKEVTEFAVIDLTQGSPECQWTAKDANFCFALEVKNWELVPYLDKSLARASILTLPKGLYKLWGYSIEVIPKSGTVKFAHGKPIQGSEDVYFNRHPD